MPLKPDLGGFGEFSWQHYSEVSGVLMQQLASSIRTVVPGLTASGRPCSKRNTASRSGGRSHPADLRRLPRHLSGGHQGCGRRRGGPRSTVMRSRHRVLAKGRVRASRWGFSGREDRWHRHQCCIRGCILSKRFGLRAGLVVAPCLERTMYVARGQNQ